MSLAYKLLHKSNARARRVRGVCAWDEQKLHRVASNNSVKAPSQYSCLSVRLVLLIRPRKKGVIAK